ncbi:MAG: GAF domain-containing protein [Acidimicrobiaceae bacterium]|nr:GAF domain-containing protein [Acidimicrobiaceae bacterium]
MAEQVRSDELPTDDESHRSAQPSSRGLFGRPANNSLSGTIRTAFFSLVLIIIISSGVGTASLLYSKAATSNLLTRLEPLISANKSLLIEVYEMDTTARNYLRTGQSSYADSFKSAQTDYASFYISALQLETSNEKNTGILQSENAAAQNVIRLCQNSVFSLASSQLTPESTAVVLPDLQTALNAYTSRYNTTNALFTSYRDTKLKQLDLLSAISTAATIASGLGGLVLALYLTNRIRNKVQVFLSRLTVILARLQAGEIGARASETGLSEEILLAKAINSMASEKEALTSELEQQYAQEKQLREGLEMERSIRMGLSSTLYRDVDVTSALQRTVSGLGSALHADRALVRTMENGVPGSVISEWSPSNIYPSMYGTVGSSILADKRLLVYGEDSKIIKSLHGGSAVAVNDISNDERFSEDVRTIALSTGLGAFLSVPVMGPQGLEAILTAIMEGKVRNWNDRDIQVAQTMASGLAATLSAIRLYEDELENVEKMRKLDESKDAFLASVSHELRTPLTSIVGYLELLQDDVADGAIPNSYSGMFDAIERNSKRLLDLIENILTTSRIDSGVLKLSKTWSHITPLLMRTTEAIMPQLSAKHIDLKVQIKDRLPDICADFQLLERAMLNLLSNAIKFTPDNGTISMTAFSESNGIAISISDSGVGIADDELNNLFTKFYRASTAQANAIQGTGLGLVIVKAIVEQHGGTVTVTSKLGEGSTFTLRLPISDSDPYQTVNESNEKVGDQTLA